MSSTTDSTTTKHDEDQTETLDPTLDPTLDTELDSQLDDEAEPEPEPIRFADTALDRALVKALADKGIETAFPIQELTLPMALRGQDVIGQARTGTGKTFGFGLPLLHRIDPSKQHVQALIVAPTRELTAQVCDDLQVGEARGLHVTSVYGGVPIEPQFEALKTAHVVVGTPGRLLDHLGRRTLDLSHVTELVLDEADEMLDMGFLPDVEQLIAACPSERRHTMLFSATMAPAIVSLARRYMDSPSFMHAKSDEPQTADLVEQHFFQVHRMDKPRVLARIMQQPGRDGCYVFTRTKAMADRLVTELEDLGVSAIAIHGDLRQSTREKNLDKFREGKASILVATEVAARGLDVDNVTHVVNYDCPQDDKMYLHRIGRTARAGRSGVAVTFAEHNEVDKINVIRKAVGAHEAELKQVFSTSDELAQIFDLPDETPWDHLARTKAASTKGGERHHRGSRGSGKGSSKRDDRSDRSERSDGSRSRDNGRNDDRKQNGRSHDRKRNDRNDDRKQDDRNDDRGGRSRDTDRSSDGGSTRTRTRTRTRVTGDDDTGSSSRSRSRARDTERDDRGGRDNRDSRDSRDRRDDDRSSRSRSSNSSGSSDERSSDRSSDRDDAPRKRARVRARGGQPTSAKEKGASDDDKPRGDGDRSRSSSRDGNRSRGSSSSRSSSSRSSSSGGRSRSGGKGQSGRANSGRSSQRSSGSAARSSGRTTAERITKRGTDARGEGTPRHTRRLEVENLP